MKKGVVQVVTILVMAIALTVLCVGCGNESQTPNNTQTIQLDFRTEVKTGVLTLQLAADAVSSMRPGGLTDDEAKEFYSILQSRVSMLYISLWDQYNYRSYDKTFKWRYGTSTAITLTGMPTGEYELNVCAYDNDYNMVMSIYTTTENITEGCRIDLGQVQLMYSGWVGTQVHVVAPTGYADGYYDLKSWGGYIGWIHLVGGVGEGNCSLPAFKGPITLELAGYVDSTPVSTTKTFPGFSILEAIKHPPYTLDFSQ